MYVDRVFTRCELHGIFKDCVPILINLLINSYFSRWFGIETLCQNLSAVRTNWILLLVAPNLHLSLNVRYSQIFSSISFGSRSSVATGISGVYWFLKSLYDSRPFSISKHWT